MTFKLAYLGPRGSFSYEAAIKYKKDAEHIEVKSFYNIMDMVENEEIEEGILPIENSTEGAVTPVMDGLLEMKNSYIKGEIVLDIVHNILGKDKNMGKIKYIYSHPQVLGQCREYFEEKYPDINLMSCESSSRACAIVKEKGSGYAAIGNIYCAQIHDLNIIEESIEDNTLNQTRFIIISKKKEARGKKNKTSMALSFYDDRPGSLYSVLKIFADRKINLTRIESRPAKAEIGKYIFYIDFHGHEEDKNIIETINLIKEKTKFFKIFGSYRVD